MYCTCVYVLYTCICIVHVYMYGTRVYILCTCTCNVHVHMYCTRVYVMYTCICTVHVHMYFTRVYVLYTCICTVHVYMYCTRVYVLYTCNMYCQLHGLHCADSHETHKCVQTFYTEFYRKSQDVLTVPVQTVLRRVSVELQSLRRLSLSSTAFFTGLPCRIS